MKLFFMKKLLLLVFVIAFCRLYALDQTKIDSLTVSYNNTTEDSVKISALIDLYKIYYRVDNYVALEYADKILKQAKSMGSYQYEDTGLYYKMLSFMFIGNYEKSLEINMSRLELNKQHDNIAGIFGVYHDIGAIYDRLQQYDLSLEYYFKALNVYTENYTEHVDAFSSYNIQSLYNNIGNIYSSRGDYEKAKQYYQKGIGICLAKKDFMNLGAAYNNLGKIYTDENNAEKALWYLNQALHLRDSIRDENGMGTSYAFLSYYYFAQKQYDSAVAYARQAYDIGEKIASLQIQSQSSSMLAEVYDSLQQYDSAYFYYKIYKDLNDSIIGNETFREIQRLKLRNEFEIMVQNQKLEGQKVRFKIAFSVLLSILLLGILFFLLRYYKDRKERIKSENKDLRIEVEIRNKELTANVMQQMRRNSLLVSIEERLMSIKRKLSAEQKEQIQKVIFELRTVLSDNDVSDEFEVRFQQVHEEFYENLKHKYPQLSPSEIKLAAFLRLNMTTKDISSLTGLSIKSIESSRYRLRKKLGITNKEINLVNFLLEI